VTQNRWETMDDVMNRKKNSTSMSGMKPILSMFNFSWLNCHKEVVYVLIKGVPCCDCMGYPLRLDEGDDLQILGMAVNMLNMQSWTADNRWSISLGIGQGLNTSYC
jgi:hypothetical protein